MKKILCMLITAAMILGLVATVQAADAGAPAAPEGEAIEAADSANSEGEDAEAAESANSEGEDAEAVESADSEGEDAEAAESTGELVDEGESAESSGEEGESDSGEGESEGGFTLPSVEDLKQMTEEEKREAFGMEPWDDSLYTGVMLTSPDNDMKTDLQYSYAMDEDYLNVFAYAHGWSQLSIPRGVVCDFSADEGIGEAAEYMIQRSSTEDFSDPVTVTGLTEKVYYWNNLMLGEHFYWRAGTDEASLEGSPIHEVTVNTVPPRVCYAEGGHNIRDVGGYDTYLVPGAKINQGLLYRGANLDDITEAGQKQLTDELGIRVEINMREEEDENGFIDGVEYYNLSMPDGSEPTRFEEFSKEYKKTFELIANADNAPVYLHCNSGADRTGLTVFILLNLLGVSYEDIARDYLYTNFTDHFERVLDDEFLLWWDKLDFFAGDTKAEQAKNWLLLKGVSEEDIEHIREIFIEGYIVAPAE